jgi:single-stranded-DNA-specific exonuclease
LLGRCVDSFHVGFVLGLRLNAAGRRGRRTSLDSSCAGGTVKVCARAARQLAGRKHQASAQEADILAEAKRGRRDPDVGAHNVLIGRRRHRGVICIVAPSSSTHYKPALVLSIEDGVAHGSARSIPGSTCSRGSNTARTSSSSSVAIARPPASHWRRRGG